MSDLLRGKQIQSLVDAVLIHASGSPEACNAAARTSLRATQDLSKMRAELRRLGLESEFDAWLETQTDDLRMRDASDASDTRR